MVVLLEWPTNGGSHERRHHERTQHRDNWIMHQPSLVLHRKRSGLPVLLQRRQLVALKKVEDVGSCGHGRDLGERR